MFQRRRLREKQGRTERGNVFKDTRVGRALSDALGSGVEKVKDAVSTPSNYAPYSEQSFAERTGRKPKFVRRKSKSTPESRKAAQRRNEAKSRGQAKGRMNYYRDRLDRDREESSSKNQARKGAAEMIQRMDKGLASQESRDGWNSLFDHLEAMGTMPDPTDTEVLEEVLSPGASSSNIANEEVEEVADAIAEDVTPEPYEDEGRDFIGEFEPELAQPTGADLLSYGVEQPYEEQGPPDMRGEMFEQGGGSGPYVDQPVDEYDAADPREFNPDRISLGPSAEELENTLAGRMREESELDKIRRLTTAVQLGGATGDEYFELMDLMRDNFRREGSPRIQEEIPQDYGAKRGSGPYATGYPESKRVAERYKAGKTKPLSTAEVKEARTGETPKQDRKLTKDEQRMIMEARRQGRRALSQAARRAAARRGR